MISDHLNTYLLAQSAITSLVSDRIYPVILPQQVSYPAVTYNDDDSDYVETFDGQDTITDTVYQIDAWGRTYASAIALGDVVRTSLKNTVGEFGGIMIHKCIVIAGPLTVYEDVAEAYRQTHTFLISHNEV